MILTFTITFQNTTPQKLLEMAQPRDDLKTLSLLHSVQYHTHSVTDILKSNTFF